MASTISVTLKMIDQMSQKMDAIANSGDKAASNIIQFGDRANTAFDRATEGSQKMNDAMQSASSSTSAYADSSTKAQQALEEQANSADRAAAEVEQFGSEAEEAGEQSEQFGAKASKSAMDLGEALVAAGIVVTLKEIAAAYLECDDAADQFEASMAKVSTIADTSAASLETIQGDIVKLSQDTGQSVNDLAESAYSAISASVDTADAVSFVAEANTLAVGGFTQSATAVDVLTTAINAYGMSADEASSIADKLINTQNLGKTTVDELAGSMGMVIPTAAAFGVSLDNLASAYVTLTRNGINTANATTMINGMLSELGDTSSDVAKILESETGKSFSELMDSGATLGDIMGILGESVNGSSDAFINLWGNVRAGRGAVNIFNAGAEEFASVMDSMANSAGAADEAFKKMTSTGQFVEQQWTNAIQNFKIAIGDAAPSLDGLMTKGTEVLNKLTEFVSKNPQVVGAITAAVVALGTFVVAVEGVSIAMKAGAAAMEIFNAALMSNPYLAAAAAVAALVAGFVVLESTFAEMNDQSNQLTVTSQQLAEEIEEQKSRVEDASNRWGEFDERTLEAKIRLEDLEAQFESSAMTIGELDEKISSVKDSLTESAAAYRDNMQAIDGQASSSAVLVQRLNDIENAGNKTEAQRQVEAELINRLNGIYPELGLQYDVQTGKLNKTTQELKEYCKQQAESAKQQATVEEYTDALVRQSEAQEVLNSATAESTAAQERYNELREHLMQVGQDDNSVEDMNALANAMSEAQVYMEQCKERVEEANGAFHDASDAVSEYEEKLGILPEDLSNISSAAGEAGEEMMSMGDMLGQAASGCEEQIKALAEAYDQAFNSALSSINSQIGLFDDMETNFDALKEKSGMTADEIKSKWEEQSQYLEEYNANLEKLRDVGISDEFLSSLADGSEESAGKIKALADEIDALAESTAEPKQAIEEFVEEFNSKFEEVQQGKETLAETLAEMNSEVQSKMDELVSTMQGKVSELDMGDKASENGRKTFEAYAKAIKQYGDKAVAEAQRVANEVAAALNSANASINASGASGGSAKHASGTTYGENVYIAGEYGPELIVGRQGSEVFPASETAKILNAVMNIGRNSVEVAPQEITNTFIQSSSTTSTESKNITLTIKGKGALDIGGGVSLKDVRNYVEDELEGALMAILRREVYEEGAVAYEY